MQTGTTTERPIDVLIVGGGWSGLYAGKYAKAEGLEVCILEARESLGGVWNFSECKAHVTVMQDTVSSSSRAVTEASDFAMSDAVGNFMHHRDVFKYLEAYADHFDLLDQIHFNCHVVSAEKDAARGVWTIHTADGRAFKARHVVICAGVHQSAREIGPPVDSFKGYVYHAGEFKHFDDFDPGEEDHVVVYGGGETASDIISILAKKRCKLTWAIRGGQHFFRKTPKHAHQDAGEYDRWDNALDTQGTVLHTLFTNFSKSKPGMRWGCNLSSTGTVFSYQGHGIAAWESSADWFHGFFNKNAHVLDHVWNGRVKAAPGIQSCEGRKICFEDGTNAEATHIICCFGYVPDLQFLLELAHRVPTHLLYGLVFNPDDPTLSYIGYARPTVLSLPFMAELQCMWASAVWSGRLILPDSETMRASAKRDYEERKAFFPQYTNPNVINPFTYTGYLLRKIGTSRRAWKDWHVLRYLILIPFTPLFFRILTGRYTDKEVARLGPQSLPAILSGSGGRPKHAASAFLYCLRVAVLILVPRLFQLDRVFDAIAKRRMRRFGVAGDFSGSGKFGFWSTAMDRAASLFFRKLAP